MYLSPKDSRQRYTKQCLFEAFLHNLETKPVSAITVSEISEEAGVSRKTFYKYYSDQFALLQAMQDDLFIGFKESIEHLPDEIFNIAPAILGFVDNHRVLVRAALQNSGEDSFTERVVAYLYHAYRKAWEEANPSLSAQDVKFLFHYVVSGVVGIIRLWLFEEPEMSTAEVGKRAEYLLRLTTP